MKEFIDKYNVETLQNNIRMLKTVGDILNFIEHIYKGWLVGFFDTTCDSKLEQTWEHVERKTQIKRQQIVLVKYMMFNDEQYRNITYLGDVLTQCGFLVVDQLKYKECKDHEKCVCCKSSSS